MLDVLRTCLLLIFLSLSLTHIHSLSFSHSFFSYRLLLSFSLTHSPVWSLTGALTLAHFNTHTHTLLLPLIFIPYLISFNFSHLIPSSGTDRSIVSDVAGTTRDTVDALVVRYIHSDFVCTLDPSYFIICFFHSIFSLSWLTTSVISNHDPFLSFPFLSFFTRPRTHTHTYTYTYTYTYTHTHTHTHTHTLMYAHTHTHAEVTSTTALSTLLALERKAK